MSERRVLFDLFDVERGEKRRDEGMKSASEHHKELVGIAKMLALNVATFRGTVNADEVVEQLIGNRYCTENEIGKWLGSIFADKKHFEHTGNWIRSARVSNRGRFIRVWRLKR